MDRSKKIFTAASATTTSELCPTSDCDNYSFVFIKTGTGTGSLAMQVNNMTDKEYAAAPTTGWVQHDMAAGSGVTAGAIDVAATDPYPIDVKIPFFRVRRIRWVYTHSAGTVALSGWAGY